MKLLRLLALYTLLILGHSFAIAGEAEDQCREFSEKQLQSMKQEIANYERELASMIRSGDIRRAQDAHDAAQRLSRFSCRQVSERFLQLQHDIMLLEDEDSLLYAAKAIAEHEYGLAVKELRWLQRRHNDFGIPLPEGHGILLKTAHDGYYARFFSRLDGDYFDGVTNKEEFGLREKNVCSQLSTRSDVTPLARCKKYD
jgi:hypothetical protein